jgi:hypothetical protein
LSIAELKESIADHEQQLQALRSSISELEIDLSALKSLPPTSLSTPNLPLRPISTPAPAPTASRTSKLKKVEFPLRDNRSVEGIISYLPRKHGGNVHDRGIITITSKSVFSGAPRTLADFTSDSGLYSKNEPGQWVCWDFRNMRMRPTHYTIRSDRLKSWVVESSIDGSQWTEIDRKRESKDFNGDKIASYAFSSSGECRFVRLTQTDKNHKGNDFLAISVLEFFGILLE